MPLLQPGARVAIFGDSHMEALGPRLRRTLPQELGVTLTNVEARRGWSTRGYLNSGDIPGLANGADVVIVELGGNDAAARTGPEQHAEDVRRVLGQLAGKRVIWLGPGVTTRPDLEAYRDPIRDAQRQVVESAGGAWINSQDLTRERELRDDGVHFSAGGYDRWAQALLPRLARVVGGPQGSQGLPVWVGPVAVGAGALFALGAYLWSRSR